MSLPAIDNDTDFIAEPHLLVDKQGERLCIIVKATWELSSKKVDPVDGSFTIAPKDRRRKVRGADFPWGKPEVASIRYPSDLCVKKPGTDIVVVARAYAPGGKAVPSFDAGVRLGRASKVVRIHGPRVWLPDGRGVSASQPINMLEMRYDFAFGGTDMSDPEKIVSDARNPVGRGIAADLASLENTPAPQIEDPAIPIDHADDLPKPAGLGPLGRHYQPRRELFGSYGGDWVEKRSPLPPADFDERANFCAPPELILSPPIRGGEEGALSSLSPGGGNLSFVLPRFRIGIKIAIPGREAESFELYCDTVVLDSTVAPPPTGPGLTVEMVGRASVVAPRRLAEAKVIVSELRR